MYKRGYIPYKLYDEFNILSDYIEELYPKDNAINIFLEYPDKINWCSVSENPNETAIKLLKENPDKIE